MAVQNMAWQWGGVNAHTTSLQVNFGPTQAAALCSLSQAGGGGPCAGGITQYRSRTQPDGPDQDHNFGVSGATYWLPPKSKPRLTTNVLMEAFRWNVPVRQFQSSLPRLAWCTTRPTGGSVKNTRYSL
jgi:hypothetical protein